MNKSFTNRSGKPPQVLQKAKQGYNDAQIRKIKVILDFRTGKVV